MFCQQQRIEQNAQRVYKLCVQEAAYNNLSEIYIFHFFYRQMFVHYSRVERQRKILY